MAYIGLETVVNKQKSTNGILNGIVRYEITEKWNLGVHLFVTNRSSLVLAVSKVPNEMEFHFLAGAGDFLSLSKFSSVSWGAVINMFCLHIVRVCPACRGCPSVAIHWPMVPALAF